MKIIYSRLFLIFILVFKFDCIENTKQNVLKLVKLVKKIESDNSEQFMLIGNPYSDDTKYTTYENDCLSYYIKLNKAFSNFTDCAARTARPFNLCQSCVEQYYRANYIYNLINDDKNIYATTLYKNGLTCKDIVEATNRVQIVVKLFNLMSDIWTSSNCDSCFEQIEFKNNTANYTIKREINEFREMEKTFQDCIFNYTNISPSLDPIFQNYTSNQTLCAVCKDHYVNLTKKFSDMMKGDIDENGMCMDIVDSFNFTRISWSKGYKCSYRNIDEYSILIIALSFTVATVAFYIISRLINTKETIEFAIITPRKSLNSNID